MESVDLTTWHPVEDLLNVITYLHSPPVVRPMATVAGTVMMSTLHLTHHPVLQWLHLPLVPWCWRMIQSELRQCPAQAGSEMMEGADPSSRLMMGHLLDVIQTLNISAALLMVTVVGLENTVPVIHVSTIDLLDSQEVRVDPHYQSVAE